MPHLNYHHLRLFWAIANEGALNRAAERLHISQSAVSSQLKKLEDQLGHPLFERSGKRLIITEAGKIALDYANTIFRAGNDLLSTLEGKPKNNRQILRVGALTTLSRNFQIEFLRPVVDRSDVELIIRSGTMRELLTQLEGLRLDVVLANMEPHTDLRISTHSYLLKQQPISIVGRKRRNGRRFKYPDHLAEQPIILPSSESDIRNSFDRAMAANGITPIVAAEVDDMAMLRVLARESSYLALVPPIVVRDELDSGILHEYCQIPEITENFYAILQQRRFPNALLKKLISK
jgi:LysR family transcriptional regulator, transcriptional activator of nhaA